ncbi:MAG: DUF7948 domain-containing protein [Candidatus Thorarchaeota archaeon]
MLVVLLWCLSFVTIPLFTEIQSEPMNSADILIDQSYSDFFEQVAEFNLEQYVENQGQLSDSSVLFYGEVPGGFIFFHNDRVSFRFLDSTTQIVFSFMGSNNVTPIGCNQLEAKSNYFLGKKGTYLNVVSYQSIVYHSIWRNIDLVYKATTEGSKYEFHVLPGGDPSCIEVEFSGHDKLLLEPNQISIERNGQTLMDDSLVTFQDDSIIESYYDLVNAHTFGFEVGAYDHSKTLVIDPLLYSTYVGGSEYDAPLGCAVDDEGNIYVTGITESLNFPLKQYFDGSGDVDRDGFLFKLNSTGNGIVYSTYFGGSEVDEPYDIAIDAAGNAYMTGTTLSADFPTMNAYDSGHNGGLDVFIIKFNSTGNGLEYSTYLGNTGSDIAYGIDVDIGGNMYVCGKSSYNFPLANAFDSVMAGGGESFTLKLSSDGSTLIFSTYMGGSAGDAAYDIVIDEWNCSYVTGDTSSDDIPLSSAFDSSYNGNSDILVYKLSATGSLEFSTYYGGGQAERGLVIDVNSENETCIGGRSLSSDLTFANPYNSTYGGNEDGLLFMLNSTGNGLVFSTLIGGSGYDEIIVLSIDAWDYIYFGGYTASSTFPTKSAYNSTYGEGSGFMAKLNSSYNGLLFSTFIAASTNVLGLSVNSNGTSIVCGTSYLENIPMVNSYNSTNGGSGDAYVLALPDYGDSDNDAISDYNETLIGTDRFDDDSDDDLLLDGAELYIHETDPLSNDSDSDS